MILVFQKLVSLWPRYSLGWYEASVWKVSGPNGQFRRSLADCLDPWKPCHFEEVVGGSKRKCKLKGTTSLEATRGASHKQLANLDVPENCSCPPCPALAGFVLREVAVDPRTCFRVLQSSSMFFESDGRYDLRAINSDLTRAAKACTHGEIKNSYQLAVKLMKKLFLMIN